MFERPTNIKPGVCPRKTEYGKLKGVPVLRDALDQTIPKSDWPSLISSQNKPECSSFVWEINDQDSAGSCASEGVSEMNELSHARAGRPKKKYNPWATYHFVNGGVDGGSSLDDNIARVMTYGSVPEEAWPRYDEDGRVVHSWREKPSDDALQAALDHKLQEVFDLNTGSTYSLEMGTCLVLGWSVYYGYDSHAVLATELISAAGATREQLACADAVDRQVAQYRAWLARHNPGKLQSEPLGRDLDPTADDFLLVYLNSWDVWGMGRGSMPHGFGTMRMGSITPGFGLFAARGPVWEQSS